MNTRIEYLYRDADNYKVLNQCVVPGVITKEQQQRIMDSLDEGEYFVPSMVGMPEMRFGNYDSEVDHSFFELGPFSFAETKEEPTVEMTPEELTLAFEAHKDRWNVLEQPRALELLNLVIDDLIEQEGGHASRVAEHLMDIGFTRSDLLALQFSEDVLPDEDMPEE